MPMSRSEIFRKWGIFRKTYDAAGILNDFANHIEYTRSKDQYTATLKDLYFALALTTRSLTLADRLVEGPTLSDLMRRPGMLHGRQ